jgi:hypothetical protein
LFEVPAAAHSRTKNKAQSTKLNRQFAAVFPGAVKVISTRRFLVRPETVVFGATGFDAPIPLA